MSDAGQNDSRYELDHEYDGIRELNFPLPRWWLTTFYLTIVFSVFYSAYYLTGWGPGLGDELKLAMKDIEARRVTLDAPPPSDEEQLLFAAAADPQKVKHGQEVFTGKCAACHGDKGQGVIGPNLTDDHWIHGDGGPSAIAKVIRDGVLDKGMPPWGAIIPSDDVRDLVAFIRSIHGTNPPAAKDPQGERHEFRLSQKGSQ